MNAPEDATKVAAAPPVAPPRRPRTPYIPALGPRLRALLALIFALVALLGATGIYLLAIRVAEALRHQTLQSAFSLWMTLAHIVAGLLITAPFLIFGITHLATARRRPNRVAVRLGVLVFTAGVVIGVTGILLVRLEGLPQLPTETVAYWAVYGLHAAVPVAAVVLYVLHRRAGPRIRWGWGYVWGGAVACFVAVMLVMHAQNPRRWFARGSPEGEKYFEPSRSRTLDGKFIPASAMMMDGYCLRCHPDIYQSHLHSAHRLSSFNNPAYLFSVRETRRTAGVRASRWCAGCHDPVPLFSGQFDDPAFDDVHNPTSQAGITCVVCHSITHVNSRTGNGDYTIEESEHYPFAFSDSPLLQWVNNQLVKSKPDLHKKTFLKDFHRSEEFCAACHKVGIPQEVNHYKEFLRGQNHTDSFLLSGVSGHGARSWYYPQQAKTRCAECHMPLQPSNDFGARDFEKSGRRTVHSHFFPAANTGLHALLQYPGVEESIDAETRFLRGGPDGRSPPLRIDLFGLKPLAAERGVGTALVDDQPLRPHLPRLQPGASYLVEVVVRTLNIGHHFTQGTTDSNEVWVELIARSGGRVLGHSGGMSGADGGRVDEGAHFLNVLMLDRHGNRIDRRNPQDIFTPLYDHQIAPGAAAVVHYRLDLPRDLDGSVELSARVRYRKFDYTYMEKVYGPGRVLLLPIVDLCSDRVVLPVAGVAPEVPPQLPPFEPAWQRWNDYGIGCFLEGGPEGKGGGELGQAEQAFRQLLGPEFRDAPQARAQGHLNLARVHLAYGGPDRLEKARRALVLASQGDHPAPWQTVAWLSGLVNLQNVNLAEAVRNFEQVLDPARRDPVRGFDFTQDYVVINDLGKALFTSAQQEEGHDLAARDRLLRRAAGQFERTLRLDPENVTAHEFLARCYARLGGPQRPAARVPAVLTAPEQLLLERIRQVSILSPGERVAAALRVAEELRHLEQEEPSPGLQLLLQAHRAARAAHDAAEGPWLRLALAAVVTRLDARLLAAVPDLGRAFTDGRGPLEDRLAAADALEQVLGQLEARVPQADVSDVLVPLAVLPAPGLPVGLAVLGAGHGGHLQGPLPPPRLLILNALRPRLQEVYEQAQPQLREAAARTLGRMHRVLHGIYKPDENAADSAVRRYRDAHPAAAHASHAVVIYDLQCPSQDKSDHQ
jgi:hypothetical protein